MFIVIIDMDQQGVEGGSRKFLGMTDDWELAPFDTREEIVELKKEHNMGVFNWLVININTDPPVSIINPIYSLEVLE